MKIKIGLMALVIIGISACATPSRFEYGAYESTLYTYFKKPEHRDKYESALEKAIAKGEATDRIAPGLYAELGYLRLQSGDDVAAIDLFNKEKSTFPEAEFFMSNIVAKLTGDQQPNLVDETAVETQSDVTSPPSSDMSS